MFTGTVALEAPERATTIADAARRERAREVAGAVPDPEIPVVTLAELGILRDVVLEDGRVVVQLTPTYTGCPATELIADEVRTALSAAGLDPADVRLVLAPAWTTDWITPEGRDKLRAYGIAPPACGAGAAAGTAVLRFVPRAPRFDPRAGEPDCPRCGTHLVERVSQYGSTPCKALYRCLACREPFDYFKPY